MKAIVCTTKDWKIGNEGRLLYHIPEDMERFRKLTSEHRRQGTNWLSSVVMGRKTFESLPGKQPLPNRQNFVISSSLKQEDYPSNVFIVPSIKKFTESSIWKNDIWCIGGGSIYEQLLSYCTECYVTRVLEDRPDATDVMPDLEAYNPKFELECMLGIRHSVDKLSDKELSYRFEYWVNPTLYFCCCENRKEIRYDNMIRTCC